MSDLKSSVSPESMRDSLVKTNRVRYGQHEETDN